MDLSAGRPINATYTSLKQVSESPDTKNLVGPAKDIMLGMEDVGPTPRTTSTNFSAHTTQSHAAQIPEYEAESDLPYANVIDSLGTDGTIASGFCLMD
ncbi:hypothetical protein FRC00_008156 [Tulasnella sp. 408]|nr:hypothetical protein FRC00_008156 [Tulasnella sp. 408]